MPDFAKSIRQLRPLTPKDQPQRHLFQAENPAASLSQQLGYLRSRNPLQQLEVASGESIGLPAGDEEVTPYGRHYVVREVLDSEHAHGKVRVGRFSCDDLRHLMEILHGEEGVADRDSILFLDTETTGMQGSGMVPFLV